MTTFDLGQVLATPGALEALQSHGVEATALLQQHARGEWGELNAEDRRSNDEAVRDGGRILSSYRLSETVRVWVITEAADERGRRLATTLLLPAEY